MQFLNPIQNLVSLNRIFWLIALALVVLPSWAKGEGMLAGDAPSGYTLPDDCEKISVASFRSCSVYNCEYWGRNIKKVYITNPDRNPSDYVEVTKLGPDKLLRTEKVLGFGVEGLFQV